MFENNMSAILDRITDLFDAAETGEYPEGTTVQDLIGAVHEDEMQSGKTPRGWPIMSGSGETALHTATYYGHLPPQTTIQDLLLTVSKRYGWTALHLMALEGNYTHDVTTKHLADTANVWGWPALHDAVLHGNLLADTTVHDLVSPLFSHVWPTRSDRNAWSRPRCSTTHSARRIRRRGQPYCELLDSVLRASQED